jgi:hypothetical protein
MSTYEQYLRESYNPDPVETAAHKAMEEHPDDDITLDDILEHIIDSPLSDIMYLFE